ncbi:hypothetical protein CSKR_113572 [Clonorchis sinensis]|uniref:Uncharacterized protein n=1 Tax=Clonorchis sinensis TaxID=79923 RepID=A0A3R7FVD8_CLOSI|nr:hypothetical protein CSKR_113572 [Clonorchis sinensis]
MQMSVFLENSPIWVQVEHKIRISEAQQFQRALVSFSQQSAFSSSPCSPSTSFQRTSDKPDKPQTEWIWQHPQRILKDAAPKNLPSKSEFLKLRTAFATHYVCMDETN